MSSVDLKCPHCGVEDEYDFCEKNGQEEEYELECYSCEKSFKVWHEWQRVVDVLCLECGRNYCNCGVNKE